MCFTYCSRSSRQNYIHESDGVYLRPAQFWRPSSRPTTVLGLLPTIPKRYPLNPADANLIRYRVNNLEIVKKTVIRRDRIVHDIRQPRNVFRQDATRTTSGNPRMRATIWSSIGPSRPAKPTVPGSRQVHRQPDGCCQGSTTNKLRRTNDLLAFSNASANSYPVCTKVYAIKTVFTRRHWNFIYRIHIPYHHSGVFRSGCQFGAVGRKPTEPNFITVIIENLLRLQRKLFPEFTAIKSKSISKLFCWTYLEHRWSVKRETFSKGELDLTLW